MNKMENENQTTDSKAVLVTARLTETQVLAAITEHLLKNEEIKEAVENKTVAVNSRWQTSKWSDPDALVHVIFTEAQSSVSDEFNATLAENTAGATVKSESTPEEDRSPFFVETT